jgi:hypothetical protein
MRRNGTLISLLLNDERSAVERRAAVLFALLVLVIACAGLILMSLGEYTYRGMDRRILTASQDLPKPPLISVGALGASESQ